jgi:hypothetical protein
METRTTEISKEFSEQESQALEFDFEVKTLTFREEYWEQKNKVYQGLIRLYQALKLELPILPLDQSRIIFNIKLIYDDGDEHSKIINALHAIDPGYNNFEIIGFEENGCNYTIPPRSIGVLSSYARSLKFDIESHEVPENTFTQNRIQGRNHLEILIDLPSTNSDLLLQKLSAIADAIKILQNNGVQIDFDLLAIIKKIDAEYRLNNLSDCACAATIKQLLTLLSLNENIAGEDAIYIVYCFNALKSIDHSLFSKSHSLAELNSELLSVIDKIFSTPFKNHRGNPLILRTEVNDFLERIILCQKIKLFSPCLGKPRDDGSLYGWVDEGWSFLQESAYKLDKQGNICIEISAGNSKTYNMIYAPGKNDHNNFAKKLLTWAPHANLSFSEKTEWHKTIIFSAESSQRLLAMQLHFNVDNVKALLKAKNTYSLFQQACKSGDLRNFLVHDIVKAIFTLAFGPMYSQQELNDPLKQRNVLMHKPLIHKPR